MKRILFVHHVSSIGGGSYCLLNIIKSLDRSLFEPEVLLCTNGTLVTELEKLHVKALFLPTLSQIPYNHTLLRWGSIKGYYKVFNSFKGFKKILQEGRYDIVYLNNMMISPYLKPAKECGCKTVLHVREHWPLDEHVKQLNWIRSLVEQYCDELVAINHYSASIFPNKKSTIVYDWIDLSKRYKELPFNELFGEECTNKRVILYTGGLSRMKGADYVIDAFANDVKCDEYRLLILDGIYNEAAWRLKIKKLLLYFGIDRGMRMRLNILSDKRIKCIPPVYELAHIVEQSYCFVSYFRVPHANLALAENIILGNPCIAEETDESREYSCNGEYAMLVPSNDRRLFGKKIQEFLENIESWRTAAKRGSQSVSLMFDKTENANKLVKLLDRM